MKKNFEKDLIPNEGKEIDFDFKLYELKPNYSLGKFIFDTAVEKYLIEGKFEEILDYGYKWYEFLEPEVTAHLEENT